MSILSVEGFFDTHVHTGPAPFERLADTIQIARWCAAAGMAGIVVKSHFEASVTKAYHARQQVGELQIFSAIALNRGVGGVNPLAVEQALDQGASVVWMPTIDSREHIRVFGGSGSFGSVGDGSYKSRRARREHGGYSVLNGKNLSDEAKDVVNLVAERNAILATGHLATDEILATVDYAIGKGHHKIVVTHPEMYVPNLGIDTQVELAKAGCFMEFCAINCMQMFHCVLPEQLKDMIDAVTPSQAILATDSGQPFSPPTPETFRIFVQTLYERGLSIDAISEMAISNPARLLGATIRNEGVQLHDGPPQWLCTADSD